MALHFKPDILLTGLRPEALFAVMIAKDIHDTFGVDCWVSGGTEGGHLPTREGGLHPEGLAFDLGVRHIPVNLRSQIHQALRTRLSPLYVVLYETPTPTAPTIRPHIHVGYRPKGG